MENPPWPRVTREKPHIPTNMNGRTPAQVFKDGLPQNQKKKEKTAPKTKAA
jgi:hypothetical protein